MITLCCPLDNAGHYFARELAEEQTLENLERFSDHLQRGWDIMTTRRKEASMKTKQAIYKPAPALTENLRISLMHVALTFQNKSDLITKALTDVTTRKEMTQLVNDLFSLVEVIEGGD